VAYKAKTNPVVMIHLLESIYTAGNRECRPENRRVLYAAASDFTRSIDQADWNPWERGRLERLAQALEKARA